MIPLTESFSKRRLIQIFRQTNLHVDKKVVNQIQPNTTKKHKILNDDLYQ